MVISGSVMKNAIVDFRRTSFRMVICARAAGMRRSRATISAIYLLPLLLTAGLSPRPLIRYRFALVNIARYFHLPSQIRVKRTISEAPQTAALIVPQLCEFSSSILRLLLLRRRVSESGAEDAGIVLPSAAVPLQFLGIAAQSIGFANIADDPAVFDVIDDRQRLLRGLAEPVERGAQIFSRQQERSRLRDEVSHGLVTVGAVRRGRFAGIYAAAEPAAVVDDEYMPRATGRKAPVQLIER